MTILCFRSLDPAAALLMQRKLCWVHGDLVVSTQWRSPATVDELPLKPPPPHLKCGRTPQWCYIGDCKARGKAFLGPIKEEKFEKKTFEGHCQQMATRTHSRLGRQLRVRSTPKLPRCDSLHCGHYNLDCSLGLQLSPCCNRGTCPCWLPPKAACACLLGCSVTLGEAFIPRVSCRLYCFRCRCPPLRFAISRGIAFMGLGSQACFAI